MPVDRADFERRIAACEDSDTSRGLNFNRLFDMVRDHLGEDAARACDPQGKASRIDFFSYPVSDYLRCAWNAADRLETTMGGLDAVWTELGRRTVASFLSSVLGRTIFSIAGRDPRRVISAGLSGYRSAVSYGERTVEWRGERAARVRFRRDFMVPAFHRAVMQTALEATEARNPRVEGRSVDLLDSEYELSWE